MRDFLKSELQTLKAKTGLNQYETFSNMTDSEGKSIGAQQIKILIDSMVLACNEFAYIPDNDKKRIIQEQIIRDQDFTALNSRTIWKWLNGSKDIYWAKANAKEKDQPIVFEPLSEETLTLIEKFKNDLKGDFKPNYTEQSVDAEIKQIVREDAEKEKKKAAKHAGMTTEELILYDLHQQWIVECFDPITAKPNENWMEESDFIRLKTKQ